MVLIPTKSDLTKYNLVESLIALSWFIQQSGKVVF